MGSTPTAGHMDHVPWEEPEPPPRGYALSGTIMLSAIIILFAVVVFMVVLHLYARWYILREQRRQLLRRRNRANRRTNLVFYVESPGSAAVVLANRGLDASVLNSQPEFVYSSKTHPEVLECAVCLSELEEGEKGRLLPKCNHSFHVDCIDMWFQSHSTCPICRSPVEHFPVPENNNSDLVISIDESTDTEQCSSSGLCHMCQHEEERDRTPSLAARRKGLDLGRVTVDIPGRSESACELVLSSPSSAFRSPGSRLLSLKRILSMNRKSSPAGVGPSCSSAGAELDIERAMGEPTQGRTRAQTPR